MKAWECYLGAGLLLASVVLPIVRYSWRESLSDPTPKTTRYTNLYELSKQPIYSEWPIPQPPATIEDSIDVMVVAYDDTLHYHLLGRGVMDAVAIVAMVFWSVVAFLLRRVERLWVFLAFLAAWLTYDLWCVYSAVEFVTVGGTADFAAAVLYVAQLPPIQGEPRASLSLWAWCAAGLGIAVLGRASARMMWHARKAAREADLAMEVKTFD